jgi:DNA adenine methylase
VKPPIPYFGGKITLGPEIAGLLPPHLHYVEPYCGSLAVLLAKPPAAMETVNDLDRALVTFWRVLRERPEELARAAALGWDRHTMAAGTGQGDGWGNRTEVLWSNRPLGHQVPLFNIGGAS